MYKLKLIKIGDKKTNSKTGRILKIQKSRNYIFNTFTMKKILKKTIELLFNSKMHANHTAIKGKKSGGIRDKNGTDYNTKPYGT